MLLLLVLRELLLLRLSVVTGVLLLNRVLILQASAVFARAVREIAIVALLALALLVKVARDVLFGVLLVPTRSLDHVRHLFFHLIGEVVLGALFKQGLETWRQHMRDTGFVAMAAFRTIVALLLVGLSMAKVAVVAEFALTSVEKVSACALRLVL